MAEAKIVYTGGEIVAKAARDYRWKRYLLIIILLTYGLLSIRDGFFRYPKENAEDVAEKLSIVRHGGYDIPLNKAFGVGLPPLAIGFLIWVLYASRGSYRFDGTNVYVPSHPPIPLNAFRKIDKSKWDRKGIALIDYQIPGGTTAGRIKLDDFIYERSPTDRIFEQSELAVAPIQPVDPTVPASAAPRRT